MKILNPNNLPEALVRAVQGDEYYAPSPHRMSVTDLIGSPWVRHLKLKHYGELTADVDDMIWLAMGKAFHLLMDKYAPEDAMSEVKLEFPLGDYTLVGIPDVHQNGILYDYKVTSVYSFLLGEKIEWEQQLNCYAYMLRSINIDIKEIKIVAILKDHMMRKALEENYPKKPILMVNIPLWDEAKTRDYILQRISAHQRLIPCSLDERWHKDDTWAVKEKGQKVAKRVLPSEEEAKKWMEDNAKRLKSPVIEYRQGEDSKCRFYCNYAKWCIHNRYNLVEIDTLEENTTTTDLW